jgi:Zn-dependent M28 family amino/carboxypeptidase
MSDRLTEDEIQSAERLIEEEQLFRHTTVLASPEFGGRFPGTESEKLTLDYLTTEARSIGLTPGNRNDGSYLQQVPLVKMTSLQAPTLEIAKNGQTPISLSKSSEIMAFTSKIQEHLSVKDSEIIFVGYGARAAQWNWNDYADLDFNGKTVICLVNDPGFGSQDPNLFNGNCMTYYGRWPYKFEEAGRHGAAACFVVHNTKAASYPWHVIENGRGNVGKSFYLLESSHKHKCCVEGWLSEDAATKLFETAGLDFNSLKSAACVPGFAPVRLGVTCNIEVQHSVERLLSHNFLARIEGSDEKLIDETLVFTAHWDHLGQKGSDIYHGARDNALGVAAILEITRALLTLPKEKRKRSVMVLFTTCEEQILLGSLWYVANPIFPLVKTVACMNVDVMNTWGRTRDMSYSGKGFSELDECVEKASKRQNRLVTGEHTPETGMFYRSDHFPFAKHGVPAIYLKNGFDHIVKGAEWFKAQYSEWVVECYHKPQDQVVRDPESKWCWELSGCVEDSRLLFDICCQLIDNGEPIHWKDGAEFKHVRMAHLKEGIHGC